MEQHQQQDKQQDQQQDQHQSDQPHVTDNQDLNKQTKPDPGDNHAKREELLDTDALKDISQIKEDDKKFDERLLDSPDHSNINDAVPAHDNNPEAVIERLKKKCETQKKLITDLDAKVHEGLQREERLKTLIEQSHASKNDSLKRENEKLRTQNTMLQKEIVVLTQKFKGVVGFRTSDRAAKLEHLLKQKDKDIESLLMEKRYFEKVKREQDKAIAVLKQDRDYHAKVAHDHGEEIQYIKKNHLGNYREDILAMRDQLKECQKRIRSDEKLIKQQSHIIATLDLRQKELCDKMGVTLNPLLDQQTREELLKSMSYNQKHFLRSSKNTGKIIPTEDTWAAPVESSDDEDLTRSNIPLAEKLGRMQSKHVNMKRSYQFSEKKLKSEIEFLVSRLNDVEIRMREKEKENHILAERITDLRMRKQHLSPIHKSDKLLGDDSANISVVKQDKKILLPSLLQSPDIHQPANNTHTNKTPQDSANLLLKASDSASSLANQKKTQNSQKEHENGKKVEQDPKQQSANQTKKPQKKKAKNDDEENEEEEGDEAHEEENEEQEEGNEENEEGEEGEGENEAEEKEEEGENEGEEEDGNEEKEEGEDDEKDEEEEEEEEKEDEGEEKDSEGAEEHE